MDRKLRLTLYALTGGTLLGALLAVPLWGALAGLGVAHLCLLYKQGASSPPARRRRHLAASARFLRRLQELAAVVPEAVLLLDAAGRITWANPRAASLLGVEYDRDYGRRLVHLLRAPALAELLQRAAPGQVECLELDEWIRPGRVLELRVAIGYHDMLVVVRDITEARRVADMRKAFVADVSHELYTPLTVLSGSLEALWDAGQELRDPRARLLRQARIQVKRLSGLVGDLLSLSRLEAGVARSEHVDVPAMLEQLVAELRHALPKSTRNIAVQIDTRLHYEGDAVALRSVFSNLLRNALQYTPADGHVALRWYEYAAGVRFEIEDTGIGIPAEHLPRLTERFYRVDKARSRDSGGSGLGLSIVRHALLYHDAELEIQSRLGEGSLFRCRFPAARRSYHYRAAAAG